MLRPVGGARLTAGSTGRGRPPQAAAHRAGLEDVEKLLTSIITRSGSARRFGIRWALLGQDRIGELIGHRIHEDLAEYVAAHRVEAGAVAVGRRRYRWATSRTCAARSRVRAGLAGGRVTVTLGPGALQELRPQGGCRAVPGQHGGRQAPRRLCRSAAGPSAARGVGRALVSDHGRSQTSVPADLPQAAGQPDPADLRAGHAGRDRHAGRARVDRRTGRAGPVPSRIRNAHQVLSQILAAGVEGGRITRNPAARVRLPRIIRRDVHFLAARQVEDLAAAIDPRYALLVRFVAYTGLRAGELVALRVRHLNLLRGRCEVGESATEVDGRLVWGPTKTYARRTVPLPRFLCDQLAAYLAERPHGRMIWCSPRRRVVRCGSRSSSPASSSRRRPGPDSPTGYGSMTFAIPARACSSPKGRASRRSRPSSATRRRR
jgi:integrase